MFYIIMELKNLIHFLNAGKTMKIRLLFLNLCLLILFIFNSCTMFARYSVDGECTVTTKWVENPEGYSDYDDFMINEGKNYLAIDIIYETTEYSVSTGSKLEDFNCRIKMLLPYGEYEKEAKFQKDKNGNYFISFRVITSIRDSDMYNPKFSGQYSFYIYDVSMMNMNQPYQIYPERPFREYIQFTYPDGSTPEDYIEEQ